uniref:Uncharacterized protein n=1 Tax=Caenorhabditis japonica TaxID=281687 RepID=A0A8R1EI54_CAEJA
MSTNKELHQGYAEFSASSDQAALLQRLITAMKHDELSDELLEHLPELEAVKKLNDKLKYRKKILAKSVEQAASNNAKRGIASTSKPDEKKAKKNVCV